MFGHAQGERDMGNATAELLDICLDKDSRDNMTALIVAFPGAYLAQKDRRLCHCCTEIRGHFG